MWWLTFPKVIFSVQGFSHTLLKRQLPPTSVFVSIPLTRTDFIKENQNITARKYLVFAVDTFNQLRHGNSGGQALFPWYVNTDRCRVVAINFWWVSTATETDQVVVITNDNTTVACYSLSIASPLLSLHLKKRTDLEIGRASCRERV